MKCTHCDSEHLEIRDGKGPHYSALYCQSCQRFNKWLSKEKDDALGGSVKRVKQQNLMDLLSL